MVGHWLAWLLTAVIAGTAVGCSLEPVGRVGPKSPGDNYYRLLINGDVERYLPGQRYVVTLVGSRTHDVVQQFTRFKLTLEPLGGRDLHAPSRLGQFQLFADTLTSFDDECVTAVLEADDLPKTEVQVMWKAPPAGSGCVLLKAMVYENASRWFAEDGQLTRRVCEDTSAAATQCCACDAAKYKMVFQGVWSPQTHPKDFPTQALWLTHFSDIIGATHPHNFSFWGEGQIATDGFRSLAEWGSVELMERELRQQGKLLRAIVRVPGLWHPRLNHNTSAAFTVDRRRPLLSLASMFGMTTHIGPALYPTGQLLRAIVRVPQDSCCGSSSESHSTAAAGHRQSPTGQLLRAILLRAIVRVPQDSCCGPSSESHSTAAAGHRQSPIGQLLRAIVRSPTGQLLRAIGRSHSTATAGHRQNPTGQLLRAIGRVPHDSCCRPSSKSRISGTLFSFHSPRMYRITPMYPEDPRAPFYSPGAGEVPPLARLYLTREKLLPQSCDEETLQSLVVEEVDNTEAAEKPECAVSEWEAWSSCSVSCGKGLRMRTRRYRMPQKAQMFRCDRQLVAKEMCVASLPECPLVSSSSAYSRARSVAQQNPYPLQACRKELRSNKGARKRGWLARSAAIFGVQQLKQWSVIGWVIKNLQSRVPLCFRRHV
ncbi:hypothetical protein evm_012819 [Chilo suppressalis]|nr:hypothetical protein evm_012819 [Chilo suppressalis]